MSNRKLHFGDYVLDLEDGLLFTKGDRVSVRPQAMQVLVQLAARRGELVSRRELASGLWADPRIDEHQGLNAIIRHLRHALGDDSSSPQYIETIPTKGYRFIADCEDTASSERKAPRKLGLSKAVLIGAVAVAILGAVVVAWQVFSQEDSTLDELPIVARAAYEEGMRQYRQGGIFNSRHNFQKVVDLAPSFAEGRMMLGRSLVSSKFANLGLAEMAEPHILEAIRLNPDLATAYVALAQIEMIKHLDTTEATRLAKEALALEPENLEALGLMSTIRSALGDTYGAIDYQMQLEKIDPSTEHRHAMRGYILLWGGIYEAAARECRESLRLEPRGPEATFCLFEAYLAMGSKELAQWQAAEFIKIYGATSKEIEFIESASADEAIERFLHWRLDMAKARTRGGGDPYSLILAYWRLGLKDQAVQQVQRLIESRHFLSIVRIASDARLEPLMKDPRLQTATTLYAQEGG